MANTTTHLFDLIKALTPAEKKLIMKYAFPYKKGGDSILRKLFQLIEKQEKHNDKQLKEKIENLPTRKLELWKKIMLVLQTNNNTIEIVKARRKFDFIHILASKQLFNQIPQMLEELKEWGIKYNQLYYTAIALQYESALFQSIYNQQALKRMPAVRRQTLDIAEQIYLTSQVYEFYMRVFELDRGNQIMRDNGVIEKAKLLQKDPLYNLPTAKLSLQSFCTYNDAKSTLLYLQKDFKECMKIENTSRAAFLAKHDKTPIDLYNYCTWLTNIMSVHDHIKDYGQWEKDVNELSEITSKHYPEDLIRVSKAKLFKFWFHYRKDKFKDTEPLLQETELYYQSHKNVLTEEDLKFHEWNFIIAFFDLGNYDKAWKYCYEMISNTSAVVMPEIQEFMRLFFLLILLEKKEWAYLKSRLKQYENYVKKRDPDLYAFDLLVLDFLKQMILSRHERSGQVAHLQLFKKKIQKLHRSGHLHTSEALFTFDFYQWIDKKLSQHVK